MDPPWRLQPKPSRHWFSAFLKSVRWVWRPKSYKGNFMAFGLQTSAHSCIFLYHGTLALLRTSRTQLSCSADHMLFKEFWRVGRVNILKNISAIIYILGRGWRESWTHTQKRCPCSLLSKQRRSRFQPKCNFCFARMTKKKILWGLNVKINIIY